MFVLVLLFAGFVCDWRFAVYRVVCFDAGLGVVTCVFISCMFVLLVCCDCCLCCTWLVCWYSLPFIWLILLVSGFICCLCWCWLVALLVVIGGVFWIDLLWIGFGLPGICLSRGLVCFLLCCDVGSWFCFWFCLFDCLAFWFWFCGCFKMCVCCFLCVSPSVVSVSTAFGYFSG